MIIDFFNDKVFFAALFCMKSKIPMTKAEYAALEKNCKKRAFYVSNVMNMRLINQVLDALIKSIATQSTLKEFQQSIGKQLYEEWGDKVKNKSWRLETIYRTNCQTAYQAGRYARHNSKVLRKTRPYWRLKVIEDNRITDECLSVKDITLPANHEFWKTNYPPRHYNCRSKVIALRKNEVKPEDITKDIPVDFAPQNGFGMPPTLDYEPDLTAFPKKMQDALKKASQF